MDPCRGVRDCDRDLIMPIIEGAIERPQSRLLGSPALGTTTAVRAAVTDTGVQQVVTASITNPAVCRNVTATAGGTAADIKAIQVIAGGTIFRLHLGPYRSQEEARSIADRIQSELNLRPMLVTR